MSKKDVLHIPPPETPPPSRKGSTEHEDHSPHIPPMRPNEGPGKTPGRGHDAHIIEPQPSSNPYPGVGVS